MKWITSAMRIVSPHRESGQCRLWPIILLVLECLILLLQLQAKQGEFGWRPLFNGRDLDGWQQVGPGPFEVVDHMLKTQGGMGMLWYTREKFASSVIRVIFKLTGKEADSGVFIRIPGEPTDVWLAIN